jgi:hypothetical protein
VRGRAAIRSLGAALPQFARRYGYSPERLIKLLDQDPDPGIDAAGDQQRPEQAHAHHHPHRQGEIAGKARDLDRHQEHADVLRGLEASLEQREDPTPRR